MKQQGRSARYCRNVQRLFENHVLPTLGNKRLTDLNRGDLTGLYRELAAVKSANGKGPEGTLTAMVNRVHLHVGALLSWATREGRLPPGVAPVVPRPVAEEPGERALREETKVLLRPQHLAQLWRAAEEEQPHLRFLVRLLCLLPMRREEITGLSWSEIQGETEASTVETQDGGQFRGARLEIPAGRMKGRRPHVMPLPPRSVQLLRDLHGVRGIGEFVFSVTAGRTPFAGWGTLAARLRKRCPDLPKGWVVHDIRGGIATAMGEAGEDEAVITRLLHHAPTARIGITAVYDRSRRLQQMSDVLENWEMRLLKEVERQVGAVKS
ncbi:tyrosine-type recombinase/integrase [Roseomonas sp. BN140053]|uniref:tyrosine-type recombinase/integrase n=1 Tax=Roseomonas sp. BN140053 TaxID=3391898 RepID=UPI0039E81DEF